MKEIEDDTNKWKDILWTLIRRTNIAEMAILPKAVYIYYNPYQNPNGILHRTSADNPKICMEP